MSAYKVSRHPHNSELWIVRSTAKATIHSVYATKATAAAAAKDLNMNTASRSGRVQSNKRPRW